MKKIIIIGAGTHGRDIAENLLHPDQEAEQELLGFIDDDENLAGRSIDGIPMLGDWRWFESADLEDIEVICGSGFSETRKEIVEKALELGLSFANVVSPMAYLTPGTELGVGNVIGHRVTVCRGCVIKDHTIINFGSQVSHDNTIESFVTVNPSVNLAGNIFIDEGSYIGIGASVIQGVRIGKWSIVGAGAAVVGDIPSNVTAVGVPAKVIKRKPDND